MGSSWVFDPDAWSRIKQHLGLGGSSSSSDSETFQLLNEEKQKTFRIVQLSDHVYEIRKASSIPSAEKPGIPSAKIIFFHGLQLENSNQPHITTWLSRDRTELWLSWLLEDFKDVRILTVNYDAATERKEDKGRADMFITCENLVQELIRSRVASVSEGRCLTILVGHCLGGLVLKELCVTVAHEMASEGEDKRLKYFLKSVKGIFCYSSPHHGSELPDRSRQYRRGPLFEDAHILNAVTARRNEAFRKLRSNRKWRCRGVGESHEVILDMDCPDLRAVQNTANSVESEFKQIFWVLGGKECDTDNVYMFSVQNNFRGLIVPEGSSRFDVDEYYTEAADHFNVCRPRNKKSTIYTMLRDLIQEIIDCGEDLLERTRGNMALQREPLKDSRPSSVRTWHTPNPSPQNYSATRKVIVFGKVGSGKSTLCNMLYAGHPSPEGGFITSSREWSTISSIERKEGRGWSVIDTIGLGELEEPDRATEALIVFLKNTLLDDLEYIIYVARQARLTLEDKLVWEAFKKVFRGGESNFVVVYTHSSQRWIEQERYTLHNVYKGHTNKFIGVNFPSVQEDDDAAAIEVLKRKWHENLKFLEETLRGFGLKPVNLELFTMEPEIRSRESCVIG